MVLNFRIACQNPLPERVSANFLHDVQLPKQALKSSTDHKLIDVHLSRMLKMSNEEQKIFLTD